MTKHIYESPQLEVIEAKLETCILSNGEKVNMRNYSDENSDNPWS